MSRLRFRISMSLDGYVAGPNQSVNDPLVRTVATPNVAHLEFARG